MVRNYKKKNNNNTYDQKTLETALEALKTSSIRKVAKDMSIPYTTVQRWHNNPKISVGPGRPTVLTASEEDLIVTALLFTAKCGFPQDRGEVKDMVQSFIKHTGRETPFQDGRPGRDWIVSFEKRHHNKLRKRWPELLSTARAKGMTQENVSNFYKMYENVLKEHNLFDKPWVLFNIDETGLTADKNNYMVYVGREVKNAYVLAPPGSKTMYTVLFCISASGQYMPPYTIYKSKNMWNTWTRGGPPGATYGFSDSGWMMDINFETWFIQVFIPHTRALGRPILLTFDGHNSHITYATVKAAMDNNVILVCLPPNTSHALQPLDVGVFRSVKVQWKKLLTDWFNESKLKSVDKAVFPHLLSRLWPKLDPTLAINGFRATGLCPFNKKAVDSKILVSRADPPPQEGPRSSTRQLQNAILDVLSPPEKADSQAAMQNKGRKRTRVQAVQGEVLTNEDVLKRLEIEEENRNKKKNKKKSKPGVSITMKNVPQGSVNKSANKSTGNGKVQKSLENFGLTVEKKKVKKSLYGQESSAESSEENTVGSKDSRDSNKDVLIKELKPNISYVIVSYEGSYFPGLVVSISKSKIKVKCMQKITLTTWKWPAQDDLHNYSIAEIIKVVKTPSVEAYGFK